MCSSLVFCCLENKYIRGSSLKWFYYLYKGTVFRGKSEADAGKRHRDLSFEQQQ